MLSPLVTPRSSARRRRKASMDSNPSPTLSPPHRPTTNAAPNAAPRLDETMLMDVSLSLTRQLPSALQTSPGRRNRSTDAPSSSPAAQLREALDRAQAQQPHKQSQKPNSYSPPSPKRQLPSGAALSTSEYSPERYHAHRPKVGSPLRNIAISHTDLSLSDASLSRGGGDDTVKPTTSMIDALGEEELERMAWAETEKHHGRLLQQPTSPSCRKSHKSSRALLEHMASPQFAMDQENHPQQQQVKENDNSELPTPHKRHKAKSDSKSGSTENQPSKPASRLPEPKRRSKESASSHKSSRPSLLKLDASSRRSPSKLPVTRQRVFGSSASKASQGSPEVTESTPAFKSPTPAQPDAAANAPALATATRAAPVEPSTADAPPSADVSLSALGLMLGRGLVQSDTAREKRRRKLGLKPLPQTNKEPQLAQPPVPPAASTAIATETPGVVVEPTKFITQESGVHPFLAQLTQLLLPPPSPSAASHGPATGRLSTVAEASEHSYGSSPPLLASHQTSNAVSPMPIKDQALSTRETQRSVERSSRKSKKEQPSGVPTDGPTATSLAGDSDSIQSERRKPSRPSRSSPKANDGTHAKVPQERQDEPAESHVHARRSQSSRKSHKVPQDKADHPDLSPPSTGASWTSTAASALAGAGSSKGPKGKSLNAPEPAIHRSPRRSQAVQSSIEVDSTSPSFDPSVPSLPGLASANKSPSTATAKSVARRESNDQATPRSATAQPPTDLGEQQDDGPAILPNHGAGTEDEDREEEEDLRSLFKPAPTIGLGGKVQSKMGHNKSSSAKRNTGPNKVLNKPLPAKDRKSTRLRTRDPAPAIKRAPKPVPQPPRAATRTRREVPIATAPTHQASKSATTGTAGRVPAISSSSSQTDERTAPPGFRLTSTGQLAPITVPDRTGAAARLAAQMAMRPVERNPPAPSMDKKFKANGIPVWLRKRKAELAAEAEARAVREAELIRAETLGSQRLNAQQRAQAIAGEAVTGRSAADAAAARSKRRKIMPQAPPSALEERAAERARWEAVRDAHQAALDAARAEAQAERAAMEEQERHARCAAAAPRANPVPDWYKERPRKKATSSSNSK